MREISPNEKIAFDIWEAHRKWKRIEYPKYSYGYWYQMGYWRALSNIDDPQYPQIKPYMEGWEDGALYDAQLNLDEPNPIDIGDYL